MSIKNKLPISVIVLTLNEEIHLAECLDSVKDWVEEMIVIDSGSTDKTQAIAKRNKARVFEHAFKNQADQFNWALKHVPINGEWVLRLDADERITPELKEELLETIPRTPSFVGGFYMKRRVYFMDRWIKYGGYYPIWFLRLFRAGKGVSDNREMDEHIVLLNGEARRLKNDFVDWNKKGIWEWIQRHNNYSTREARQEITDEDYEGGSPRKFRRKFYSRLPLFFRAFAYYFYRYFIRLGFLDGIPGFIFHFLQGFWYRFLVDAKIWEAKRKI